LAACQSVAVQPRLGSAQSPRANPKSTVTPPPSPQVTGSQRLGYAWNKAIDGVTIGAVMGGPYGAGGGFIIGLITGLVMADSHYDAINNQIFSEQEKNLQLEAEIDGELARQREFEKQAIAAVEPSAPWEAVESTARSMRVDTQERSVLSPATVTIKPFSDYVILSTSKKPEDTRRLPVAIKNLDVKDVNRDGIPDIWIYYDPKKPGEIIRQEEASKYDGRVDTWTYFKDKQLVRREVDSKNRGQPDTVFYYIDEQIASEERDEFGQGRMTYRATYENGRLARVEKATSGDGRTDLWIYYDTGKVGENVIRKEKDLDGDGIVDLWSYYDNGRLVRRDVSAVGLDVLSRQERLPIITRDLRTF